MCSSLEYCSIYLPNSRNAHSLFKIPIDSNKHTECQVTGNGDLAEFLKWAHLIIRGEATLQWENFFGAVDKYLKELMSNRDLFERILVVFCGCFAQILPVGEGGRQNTPSMNVLDLSPFVIWSSHSI